jgi:hypothetical protein
MTKIKDLTPYEIKDNSTFSEEVKKLGLPDINGIAYFRLPSEIAIVIENITEISPYTLVHIYTKLAKSSNVVFADVKTTEDTLKHIAHVEATPGCVFNFDDSDALIESLLLLKKYNLALNEIPNTYGIQKTGYCDSKPIRFEYKLLDKLTIIYDPRNYHENREAGQKGDYIVKDLKTGLLKIYSKSDFENKFNIAE